LIFQINVRLFEAAITGGGRILDAAMLLCSSNLFQVLVRWHAFSGETATTNIDLRLALVLERKV
jgi:crotonobetainyl-CoA:carnitine CoA-transferase CaiB-like acyl-CoA transferase